MGFYFGRAKFKGNNPAFNLTAAFLIPFLLHGVYDFILMAENNFLLLLFIPLLIVMVIIALKQMKRSSQKKEIPLDGSLG
jgi:RsiW-degrading membrane proteinase PrsW (M82 family)